MFDIPSGAVRAAAPLLALLMLAPVADVSAQTWPAKPVRLIANATAGGSTDVVARLIAQELSATLRQPFIVDNRAGAHGNIGANAVAKAAPDGYTFLVSTNGALAQNKFIYAKSMPFDPLRDFTPVAVVGEQALVFAAPAGTTAPDLKSLLEKHPEGKTHALNVGTSGNGGLGHLSIEHLKHSQRANLTHVPFNGGAPMKVALLGGQIDLGVDVASQYEAEVRAGTLKVLAVLSEKRLPELRAVPTGIEQGYPDLVATIWYAVAAPAGTPKEIVAQVNEAINKAMGKPEFQERLRTLAMQPVGGAPSELGQRMSDAATKKWKDVIARLGLTVD